MALVEWPSRLPLPQLSGHGYTPGKRLIETRMDSGTSRFRRKFSNVHDKLSARFLMTNDQAAFFEGWFKYVLNDGANWFVMPIKTPMGLIDHEVHIKEAGKPFKVVSQKLWQIDLDLLIRKKANMPESEVAQITFEPGSVALSNQITQKILNDYPE